MTKHLNLGCGTYLIKEDGWLNIDQLDIFYQGYLKWDLSKGLPTSLLNLETIVSTHMLEHLTWEEGQTLLKDCHNKLSSGGRIHLCLPDFRKMVTAYLNKDWNFFNLPEVMSFCPNKQMLEIMNYGLYQRQSDGMAEHKTMYDAEYTIFSLQKAGFTNCKEVKPDWFDDTREVRTRYSFYVDGFKS